MKRYQFTQAFQAARWLQQRISVGKSPSAAGLAEEIVSNKRSHISTHPFSSSTGASFGSTICRAGLHKTSSSSRSLLLYSGSHGSRAFYGYRLFHTDSRGLQHFSRKGFSSKRWSVRQIVLVSVATTGFCAAIFFSHREVVPYTYRSHFVLIWPELEMRLVEPQFQALKKEWKPFILPPYHPESIRVRRIARDIIRAVLEGIQAEESHVPELDHGGFVHPKEGSSDVIVWHQDPNVPVAAQFGSREENLDDHWINKSRKKGLKQNAEPYVEHLKNMKWEVLVVDKDVVNAFCLPGGKIVVFTGLLRRFPTDEEIATVLGHEVAHVVARHSAERMTRHLFITLVQLFLLAFIYAPDLVSSMSALFLELPFSRRQELEADHIGLLLMAAEGYDPRVAPRVYEKLGEMTKAPEILQYVTTHPSGKKRGERLKKTGTMEEALRIYDERTRGTAIEGFLHAF
ncbi:hypothetical protein GOP47_0013539 [Adiantum capillus-veneris]|uniref:Peptidase M48 domain-containing protein n=1 Tax=Adiantum capillus-veneris TaxID=13818 RepID=A0A9D4ZDB2_ADICA|nr:hypothetical protein GOP47_0013539 [Adiantum capillus-veneris]